MTTEDMHTLDFPGLGEGLGEWDSVSDDTGVGAFPSIATRLSDLQATNPKIVQFHSSLPVRVEILEDRSDDGTLLPVLCKRQRTDNNDAEEDMDMDEDENDEDDVSHGAHSLSSDESSAGSSIVGPFSDDDFTIPPDLITRASTRRGKVPRLMKQDIRRHYGAMIINTLNMHDCELLQRWFQTFAVPAVQLTRLETFGPVVYADNHHTIPSVVTGRSTIASYLTEVQRRMPDIVSRMQPETYRIVRWKDRPTSQVKYNLTISGTMVQYPHLPHPDRTVMARTMSTEPQLVRFIFDVEITLHLNSEILLYRWDSRVVSSELTRIA